ncbi:MAG: hypothetical protein R3A13_04675 [Bdellovibrionota bacterium]
MEQDSTATLYPICVADLRKIFKRVPGAGRVGYIDESRDLSFGGEVGEGALEDYKTQLSRAIRCGYLFGYKTSSVRRKLVVED